jgi:elongation factor G
VEYRYIKQTGGKGQYGHVVIDVKPLDMAKLEGKTYNFTDGITGGVIPKNFIGPIDQGIQDALKRGILAGYPVLGVDVTLVHGSYHEVDSSEMAFKAAGSLAIQEAIKKCKPVLLEPAMKVEITVPDDYTGAVHGDISSRRGIVGNIMQGEPGYQIIQCEVPLANMFGFSTDLRNKTQGRATYTMEFTRYVEVPHSVSQEIMKKAGAGTAAYAA